jgi:hypothetical protein
MKNSISHPQSKQFSYLGSTAHYPKVLSFTIDYMWLIIRPDFGSRTFKDYFQKLRITACKQLDEIELDIAELDIYQITSSCADIPVAYFDVLQKNDKLIIKLGRTFYKNNTIDFEIRYSAGYYSKDGVRKIREPRSGFYFVT